MRVWFEPPPGRDVGELSARPLGLYTVSLAEHRCSIALHCTEKQRFLAIVDFDNNFDTSTSFRAEDIHLSVCTAIPFSR
jgi:hypothetical protein